MPESGRETANVILPSANSPIRHEFEAGLANGGVRIAVRARADRRFAPLAVASFLAMAAALFLAAYSPLAPTWVDAALLAAGGAGLFGWARRRGESVLVFDRAGIRDGRLRRPAIPWWQMDRIETVVGADGHPAGLVVCLAAGEGGGRFLLPSTAANGLPVPFEYLVLLLHRRGAPIRRPDSAFDPFECEIRWLDPSSAADLLVERMGGRARPFAGHQLDIAETRGDRAGLDHWLAVLAALHLRAGQMESAED